MFRRKEACLGYHYWKLCCVSKGYSLCNVLAYLAVVGLTQALLFITIELKDLIKFNKPW